MPSMSSPTADTLMSHTDTLMSSTDSWEDTFFIGPDGNQYATEGDHFSVAPGNQGTRHQRLHTFMKTRRMLRTHYYPDKSYLHLHTEHVPTQPQLATVSRFLQETRPEHVAIDAGKGREHLTIPLPSEVLGLLKAYEIE